MKSNLKRIILIGGVVTLLLAPIFRWNLTEGKYHYSIMESVVNEDVPTVELVTGNIYSKVVESDLYYRIVHK